ncbi:hypothetical protein [Paraconexibacter sp. AEG42_29]|uniref:hypothetical protein n=1 Tax=Paraconexibacter sp. AEG42_29 TaxID=2997339 RepID=UPI00339D316C
MLRFTDLELERNEASDLYPVTDATVLDAHGWDLAYWVFLDEDQLDDAIVLLGHTRGAELDDGWEHRPVATDCGDAANRTDDSEASAAFDGQVYVIGSHFGAKRGPLQPARHWFARFPEDALAQYGGRSDAGPIDVHVIRDKLRIHRLVNDALAPLADHLAPVEDRMSEAFIGAARARGEAKGKKWAARLHDGDHAFNIEGAAFRPNGNLLLGLRFPVQLNGAPVLVELAGVPAMFDDGTWPTVVGVWLLQGPGGPEKWTGIRAMTSQGDDVFDLITGNLDAVDKSSLLHDCYPLGKTAVSEHWRFSLKRRVNPGHVKARFVHAFPDGETRVEGLAHGPDDHFVYVVDEDGRVHVKFLAVA